MFFSHDARSGTTKNSTIPNLADNYKGPNVSQYGWTTYEAQQVNQLVQYVELAKEYAERAETVGKYVSEALAYIETLVLKIQGFINIIEGHVSDITTWYNDIKEMYGRIITLHQGTVDKAAEASYSANQALISQNAATAASDLAKLMATSAESSHLSALTSSNNAKISEINAKSWYDKSYELYIDLKKGQVYRGKWDPQSLAYPANDGTNSVWDVVVHNLNPPIFDWDGISWQTGQRLIYTLVDNTYSQVDVVIGVSSVNGKTGAVRLNPSDVGLISLDEMDVRYVNSKLVKKGTTPNALSVIHLMPVPSPTDMFPRSFLTGTVEVHRSDLSGEAPVFDRMEISASSLGHGFTGSILDDSGNYKLVTYSYNGQTWLGLTNKTAYPSCNIYFRGEARKNPAFDAVQFTITDYIIESSTGDSPTYPNPDIQRSIVDYVPSKSFYADNYLIYTKRDKPTANEINALDKTMGGTVTGSVAFTRGTQFGLNPLDPNTPLVNIEPSDTAGIIEFGGFVKSNAEIRGYAGGALDKFNITTKSDDGFTINNKPISSFVPVIDKVTLGLDKVNNWEATNSVDDPSETKYSTSRAVYDINRKVEDTKTLAFVYSLIM